MAKIGCIAGAVILVILVLMGVGTYNGLVNAEEAVDAAWSQVENVYQRRADLIPNLVNTVKGSANFERDTLREIVEARSRVGQVTAGVPGAAGAPGANITEDPGAFGRFQQAQDQLSSALSRLLVVVERYPELRSTEAFQNLMIQIEGAENRIAVERGRYNEVAQGYNARIRRFPAALFAGLMGFDRKEYFRSQPGAETAPKVDFNEGR
jgi:LemA protein